MKGKSAVMAVVLLLASSPVARANNVSVSGSADATSSGDRCAAFPQPQCLAGRRSWQRRLIRPRRLMRMRPRRAVWREVRGTARRDLADENPS